MVMLAPSPGQPLLHFGGNLNVRVEVDTGLEGETFGIWEVSEWDEATWGSADASWFDITTYVERVVIDRGALRWGERFRTGTANITLSNEAGIFTPESGVPNPFLLPFRPGRRMRVVVIPDPTTGLKVPLFTGAIDSSQDQFGLAGFQPRATLTCSDFMGTWGGFNPLALETPTGVQLSSVRVNAALDRLGWAVGLRDIQEGTYSLQSSYLAQTTLEECQKAADSEGGAFFCDTDGTAVFKARDWLITDTRSTTIQGYIGYSEVPDGANAAHLESIETSWDKANIRNYIALARVGSQAQVAEDEDSQDTYGIRSYQRYDYQNNTDAGVLFLAERLLERSKDLRLTVTSATITPNADPDNEGLNKLLWDTQFGDLLALRALTPYGWAIEKLVQVMGLRHNITADDWVTTLKLDDAFTPEES